MSIVVEELSKSFGAHPVLQSITETFAGSEISVLLGASGCGKTTTLRCIAGLERPASGRISLGGRVVFQASARISVPVEKRRIAMVFQSYAIWPHMTVFQNVSLPLRASNMRKDEVARRVGDALKMVSLDAMADRSATQLSGGQQQRVALARCIVSDSEFILMDEPLSNLDARLRIAMRTEIRELQRRLDRTILFVTHDQEEAMSIADTIFLFRDGRILQRGRPEAIYEEPRSRYAAEFLGKANILSEFEWSGGAPGPSVVRLKGGAEFVLPEGMVSLPGRLLCIRPEKWRMTAPETGRALQGEIAQRSYVGDRCECRVRTTAGDITVVELSGRDRKIGDRVALHVDPRDIKLVAED
ncbi:MAG: ABC transporter ATP-binding protein [Hyphomicrobiales bacterium]